MATFKAGLERMGKDMREGMGQRVLFPMVEVVAEAQVLREEVRRLILVQEAMARMFGVLITVAAVAQVGLTILQMERRVDLMAAELVERLIRVTRLVTGKMGRQTQAAAVAVVVAAARLIKVAMDVVAMVAQGL